MDVKTYVLKPGFYLRAPIAAVGARIDEIKGRHPNIEESDLVEEVIEDARRPDSPLRNCFTWDDAKAAHQARRDEARRLLRCYEVHIERPNAAPLIISPANVRITTKDGKSRFVSTDIAMSREDYRKQVLGEAEALLHGVQNRLSKLQGISPTILAAFDKLRKMIVRAAAREPGERKSAPLSAK